MKGTLRLVLASVLLASASSASSSPEQPKLALVLSGGGARAGAQVGVLRVLEELHVKPDLIVGTSLGAIIGGLYATGWSPDEIETLLLSVNWTELFIDRSAREEKSFRRKQDDAEFLIQTLIRLRRWRPYLPPGISGGQRLELLLRSLEFESTAATDFDEFPIPFRAVASNIETGDAVVLAKGSLASAMRASMSVPGLLAPLELDGHALVDGGAAANLPVRVAQDLGAQRVVAVDITTPLSTKEELGSFVSILTQMNSLLTEGNRREDLKRLRPGDVHIQPELGDMTFGSFDRVAEAIARGEEAARVWVEELRRLSSDEAEWAEFQARHRRRPQEELLVDAVHVENSSSVEDAIVRAGVHVRTGEPLDEAALRKDILRLYGLDYFGVIRHDLRPVEGRGELTIRTPAKPYGKNSLQVGLSLEDDFEGDATYALAVRHLMLAANRRGGEWVNVGQIGDTALVLSEFYQPFDPAMKWFASPALEYRRRTQAAWVDGRPVAEFEIRTEEARLDFGRVFGNWGEFRLGAFGSDVLVSTRVGSPQIPRFDGRDGGLRFSFRTDTFDSTVFPRHGTSLRLAYATALESFGSEFDYRRVSFEAGGAWTVGRNVLFPTVEVGLNLRERPGLPAAFGLGGFLRLSGLGREELLDSDYGLVRMGYYRELTKFDLGALTQRVYAGMALEAGNVYGDREPVTWRSLRYGGAVFLGAETLIGPLYIGWGWTEPDRRRFYLILGERF